MTEDAAAAARELLAANRYATLATADADGSPWASPVWVAADGDDLFWVSKPEARHSRNIAARAEIAAVLFDSTVPAGTGRALYLSARAEEVVDEAVRARGLDVFSRRSVADGGRPWTDTDVIGDARHRLYRAEVARRWILGEHDERIEVP